MHKKITSLMLLLMLFFTFPSYLSTGVDYNSEADTLKAYGLFSGSSNGYELERIPNRVEAAAMLVKLLGKEEEAKSKHYTHPFKDVPSWANDTVGYMFENKMTSGISATMFGSKQPMKAKDFTVFALKALGYGESDFSYAETMAFAEKVGLYDAKTRFELESVEFKRDEMVHVSYKAINCNFKDSTQSLLNKLRAEGVVNKVAEDSASTADAFLAGKTTRYEKTIKNINTSGNEVKINTDVVNFSFTKKDGILYAEDYAEPMVVSEEPLIMKVQHLTKGIYLQGNRFFPEKIYTQWEDAIIYFNVSLYNKGVYQMSTDFVDIIKQGHGTNFDLPTTEFDEIRLSAYPVDLSFFGTTPDDFVKIYKSSEVESIMNLVRSGTAISKGNWGFKYLEFSSIQELKTFLMTSSHYYGGVHYPNGDFIHMGRRKLNLPDADLPYDVKFVSSGFPDEYKIIRDAEDKANSVVYTFVTSDTKDGAMCYSIFDEGFKIKNIMIITD